MSMQRPSNPVLGLVIPCFNEAAVIPRLLSELRDLAVPPGYELRVLFVDDGSEDETYDLLRSAARDNPTFGVLKFSRNFGHQTAVFAGVTRMRADIVGVMDADLQDPPAVLVKMIELWCQGYDVVYGVRQNRKEGFVLRAAYTGFYRLFKAISQVKMPPDAGDFCIMDRRVVDVLREM